VAFTDQLSSSDSTMARIHTHYDNLKVARNAPPEVIRAAYKTLSQKYHPDRNPHKPDAIRIIQIINSAYEVLADPAKRQEHDEWIAREEAEPGKTAAAPNYKNDTGHGMASAARRSHPTRSARPRHKPTSFIPMDVLQQVGVMLDRLSKYIFSKV